MFTRLVLAGDAPVRGMTLQRTSAAAAIGVTEGGVYWETSPGQSRCGGPSTRLAC